MATIKLLYLGTSEDGSHEVFIAVSEEDIEHQTYRDDSATRCAYDRKAFKKNRSLSLRPGVLVSVEQGENPGSIFAGTMQNVGLWPDADTRARLQERERLRRIAADALKEAKDDDALRESLSTARAAYHQSIGLHRQQTLARIVALIVA